MSPSLQIIHSPNFPQWLQQQAISIAFTTYRANNLIFISSDNQGNIVITPQQFEQPMALAGDADRIYLSTRHYLWCFTHLPSPKNNHLYVPTQNHATGIKLVSDLSIDSQGKPLFVNTDFNCLATVAQDYNFVPQWQPPFITDLVPENRCYLSGMTLLDDNAEYITTYCQIKVDNAYQDSGIIFHLPSNQIICTHLYLPNSPRWFQGKLWLLNAGKREIGYLDRNHQFNAVAILPGFPRGLEFIGNFAVIGLSKSVADLSLPGDNHPDLWCGLIVFDLNTGKAIHWLKIEGVVTEIFDLTILPQVSQPQIVNWQDDDKLKRLLFPPLQSNSSPVEQYLEQCNQLVKENKLKEAIVSYQKVLELQANNVEALQELGNIYLQQNQLEKAIVSYQQAIKINPNDGSLKNNLANVYLQQSQYQLALQTYQEAIHAQPDYLPAYYNLAQLYGGLSHWHQARDILLQAIKIQPECADSHFQLGRLYLQQGETQKAIAVYQQTIALQPDSAVAYYHLGATIAKQGKKEQLSQAGQMFQKAIALDPNYSDAYGSLAGILEQANKKEEALQLYQKALEINPDAIDLYYRLEHLRIRMCDWQDYDARVQTLIERVEKHLEDKNNDNLLEPWILSAFPVPASLQKRVAEHRSKKVIQTSAPLAKLIKPTSITPAPTRLKIGYLSPDFCFHAVGTLIQNMFQYHNREEFEIYAYSLLNAENDPIQKTIRQGCDRFRDISTQDTLSIAEQIQADGIHILIDLGGYTTYTRPEIMALKPAPAQIHYLGFPATMGADFIPYMIADERLIPPELAHLYSEEILYLPQGWVTSPEVIPQQNLTKEEVGLPSKGIVFCNFNNSYKFNPQVFRLWMEILKEVANSVLWISDGGESVNQRLQHFAQQSGVNPQRIIFASKLAYPEHLARLQLADLCLDTFPYNAGATAVDSLWASVPVLTHPQETYVSRMATSLCYGLGMQDLICDSLAEYQAKAIEYGKNSEKLRQLKAKLAIAIKESPVFKPHLFVNELEKALKRLYYSLSGARLPDNIVKENKQSLALAKLQEGKNHKQQNDFAQAQICFQEAINLQPNYIDAYHQLGLIYQKLNHLDKAIALYLEAIKIEPNNPLILANLGIVYQRKKENQKAIEYYQKTLEVQPDFLKIYETLAKLYLDLGNWQECEQVLNQAIKLSIISGEIYFIYGNLWLQKGKRNQAIACYQKAVEIQPNLVKAHYCLGASLMETSKKENVKLAEQAFRQAISLQPDYALAYYGLAVLLETLFKKEEALQYYQQAFALDPNADDIFYRYEHLRIQICDWQDYDTRVQEIIKRTENELQSPSNTILEPLTLTAFPIPPQLQKAIACRRSQQIAEAVIPWQRQLQPANFKTSPTTLKIGYVSADFRSHPVGILIHQMFQHHTRPDFEVFVYTLLPPVDDPYQQKIRSSCAHVVHASHDRFIDVSGLDSLQIAQKIQGDDIDILIDLMGYTRHSVPDVFALKPAPVQIQYLGYPSTMGADFLPYIIADEYLIPQDLQTNYSEEVIYLPHGWVTSPVAIAQSNLSREDYGLPAEGIVYCNFNTSYKLNPHVFSMWMNILKAVEGSVLWLSDAGEAVKKRLLNFTQAQGLDPKRLIFAPRIDYEKHLARIQVADLFLDTFPYNAGGTAVDTLSVGVPLLTYSQEAYVSRMAGSICQGLGLDELICDSPEDYQQKAIALGKNPQLLKEIKQKLALARQESTVFKTEFFVKNLEKQLKQIYYQNALKFNS